MRTVQAGVVAATLGLSALAGVAVAQQDVYLPLATAGVRSPMGFGLAHGEGQLLSDYPAAVTLGAGWYHAWYVQVEPERPNGIEFVQVVNVSADGPTQGWDVVREAALANPGSTWLLGNEIDVVDQNGMTPEAYAPVYFALYHTIRAYDARAVIAPGSVAQWTPSRQRYMERVLLEYRRLYGTPLPADAWNVHAYTTPETAVGAPVGVIGYSLEQTQQMNVETFTRRLTELKAWLVRWGYGELPLIVSEYGVLWPASEGEIEIYMRATGAWLMGSGVVQKWAWFSANDIRYPGVLWDGGLTTVGRAFVEVSGG